MLQFITLWLRCLIHARIIEPNHIITQTSNRTEVRGVIAASYSRRGNISIDNRTGCPGIVTTQLLDVDPLDPI